MPLQIIRNDITRVKADAIVNTANPEPGFSRGTDGVLYRAAGEEALLAERRKIGRIPVGGAALTPAFGLDARYIIHTVGPIWQGGRQGEADALRLCYGSSLRLALEHGCESIAFPLISTGTYGFPKEEALQIALSEIRKFLSKEDMLVLLVVFDRESLSLSEKLFADIGSYIDDHYVAERAAEEYGTSYAKGVSERIPPPPPLGQNAPEGMDWPLPSAAQPSLPKMPAARRKRKSAEPSMLEERKTAAAPPPAAAAPPRAKRPSLFQRKKTKPVKERSLEEAVAHLGETFQQRLFWLIDQRGLTDVEVYKKANLDRKLFSKIRCNVDYRPKKTTAVALAVALELNLDETKDLLARAEMALSPSSKFDLIITYFIEQEVYDIYTINIALFQYGQPLLGA